MRVGSQSKTYIGTLAMQLVAANAMSLDDTLGELNKKYDLGVDLSIAPEAANVTVKQILTMSSGIADYLHVPYTDASARNGIPSATIGKPTIEALKSPRRNSSTLDSRATRPTALKVMTEVTPTPIAPSSVSLRKRSITRIWPTS